MIDYKKMYTLLCGAVSDSLDILPHDSNDVAITTARFLLQRALLEAEDIYIKTADIDIKGKEK